MELRLKEDILPVSELKKNTRRVLEQVRQTQRPVILTVNGKAKSVLMDVGAYERQLMAANLVPLLLEAERDIIQQKHRPVSSFLQDFKSAKKI